MDYCDNTLDIEKLEEYEEYLIEKRDFAYIKMLK